MMSGRLSGTDPFIAPACAHPPIHARTRKHYHYMRPRSPSPYHPTVQPFEPFLLKPWYPSAPILKQDPIKPQSLESPKKMLGNATVQFPNLTATEQANEAWHV